jgi:antitoxin component of MazEF toxin-antitoxin module
MKTEIELKKIGGSFMITLPRLYCEHINVEEGDILVFMDDEGKRGKFISFWKREEKKKE